MMTVKTIMAKRVSQKPQIFLAEVQEGINGRALSGYSSFNSFSF